jgi:hypothetical protein
MQNPYLELGPGSDAAGRVSLALGVTALGLALFGGRQLALLLQVRSRNLVAVLGCAAALMSAFYIHYFLRGGPRIVDATSYFLEARALAEGKLSFAVPEPTAAFRGRFLLAGPNGLSVIFPPGYPAALALGFLAGVPLAIGPLLAALLVVVSYTLARELLGREDVARAAAVLSTLCAALRYHTADTMSHGLSALLLAGVLAAAARPTALRAVVAGLAGGWLCATRPVSGGVAVALGALLLAARAAPRERPARALAFAAGLVPGVTLLLLHQRAATGSIFGSTQLAYYALADGPPGCFTWGFGPNVGCRFEHGDYVKAHLADGFGPIQAAWTTLQRLALHTIDLANLAPLALLVPWAAYRFRARSGVRWLVLGVAGIVLGYAPFYYPASYPGGGARLFADALPLGHALLALALVELHAFRFAPAAMLLGFGLHAVNPHLALARREGGRPMFEPEVFETAGIRSGLVFVTTDHGFSLGHDPAISDPRAGLLIARASKDAHDWLLWDRLGRPPSFLYEYSLTNGVAALHPYQPAPEGFRLEAEAEWPPLAVARGWVHPDFRPCLSRGRGLHLRALPSASLEIELVPPNAGDYQVGVGWLADPGTELAVTIGGVKRSITHTDPRGCGHHELGTFRLADVNRVRLEAGHTLLVDYLDLTRVDSKKR